ncbi:hypothetical protein P43SY_006561 [Pythium insidiosum]|uniref:PH domain-containing protein n=1 Tax=Pythium insidiosum TaxID=114742 RepID=A0AAD5L9J1_PYTIN|nr:hypothetical protein P43SY_006561 [Pythium insidiosum]
MSALEAPIRSHFHPSLPSLAEVTKYRAEQKPSETLSPISAMKEEVMDRVAVLPVFAELIRASQLTAHSPLPVLPSLSSKSSLRFILDGANVKTECIESPVATSLAQPLSPSPECSESAPSRKRKPRPANRMCKFEGCEQYVVDHGLCVRHGGGKRCTMEGCSSRAKHFGRCWRHGGSMECKVPECANRAKSRGYCWSHGGGTRCRTDACEKIAISNGLCWAHGGGKRCAVDNCMRQAYERTDNMCNSHYQQARKRAKQYHRRLTPRNVLEVVGVRDWDGVTALRTYRHGFEVEYLGGTTYQCHADSREEKQQWLDALQHALDETNRIVQDEIEEAQRHLQQENEQQEQAMSLAAEAVEAAQQCSHEAAAIDDEIRALRGDRATLETQLRDARVLLDEAQRRRQHTAHALERARHHAHDAALAHGALEDSDNEDMEGADLASVRSRSTARSSREEVHARIDRLSAQLEVDQTHEETGKQAVAAVETQLATLDERLAELSEHARECAEEGQKLREAAATSLQRAQSAKHLARLRVSSWAGATSHLDPLAEGYLLCKHPFKPSMHRRYYVLYGNTLCWYKDADDYEHRLERPSGVVHVAAVTEWNGKVGGLKTFPHSFAVVTVEGKTLYCAAPMKQSALAWDSALHIGLTMPPLSPHRAVAAKARRDSFDLLSAPASAASAGSPARRASMAHVGQAPGSPSRQRRQLRAQRSQSEADAKAEAEEEKDDAETDDDVVEGYLVKKSALVPVMKKKYCVLRRLRLSVYDSHEEYAARRRGGDAHGAHDEVLVCGVSDWDGHGALLQYHHGFEVHTARHQSVFCSAANPEEKAKWVAGIHAALLKFHDAQLSPVSREERLLAQREQALLAETGQSAAPPETETAAQRLRARVQQLYAQHNPSKLGDVPMLLERFRGRERALLEHLDRIYGTALATAPDALELLSALDAEKKEATTGLLEFVRMTGHLHWTPVAPPSGSPARRAAAFCVLSVDKLVRYASETQYETEPFAPLEVVRVLSVARDASDDTAIVVSCRDEGDNAPASGDAPTRRVRLEAASADQCVLWTAKLRSGLGVAASAHDDRLHRAATGADEGREDQEADGDDDGQRFRRQLIAFYQQHNPRKLGEVDTLLHYFAGREAQLLRDLDATYGTRVSEDPAFLQLVPARRRGPSPQRSPAARETLHLESYLWVKHAALGTASFRRCFCVLRDETWSCFASSVDAHSEARDALLVDVVEQLHYLGGKLHAMRVFSIETNANGAVLLRADLDPLFHDWTHALRRAAELSARSRSRSAEAEAEAETETETVAKSEAETAVPESHRALLARLEAFYETHHPDRVADAARLLHAFLGRERALLQEIDRIYHSHLAADASVLALLPSTQESDEPEETTAAAEPAEREILMEGYLVKRGHLVPSMRKRYCVLVRNVLSYFATHEDSRDPSVVPHGSFRVEIVSDWHGRTATQTYAHGMELETHDGKTFFCAAFSAEDKAQWMQAFHLGLARVRLEEQQQQQQEPVAGEDSSETVARRAQLRARLEAFYREHNPRKLADLELLLACYKGREWAMLEAIDATYGTQLTADADVLALLPPQDAHTQALKRLEYDGALRRAASDSDAAWRHAQSLHVVQRQLALTFFATREGFKAGLPLPSEHAVTVLAVKRLAAGSAWRFAVETTEHAWLFFEAPNAVEGQHWLEMLQAALDAVLADAILQQEHAALLARRSPSPAHEVSCRGFLTVRMDFMAALAAFRALACGDGDAISSGTASTSTGTCTSTSSASASAMVECFVELRNRNELVLFDAAQHDTAHELATLTALATRPWDPSAADAAALAPKTKAAAAAGVQHQRFAFQVVTQEQVVLSCCAATDVERATWLQRIRQGAEQARALELLAEQLDDVQREKVPDGPDAAADHERRVERHRRRFSVLDEAAGEVRGYLLYALGDARREDVREGFVVLEDASATCRVFADESAFLRQDAPVLEGQAAELELHVPTGALAASASVSPSAVASRFARLFGAGSSSDPQPAELPEDAAALGFRVLLGDLSTALTLLPASHEERALWVAAFTHGLDLLKGEQLLQDEKLVLELEARAKTEPNAESPPPRLVVPHAAMEGELTPWHSALVGATMHAGPPFFGVLVGCHLRGFPSREIACEAQGASSGEILTASPDLELLSITDWTPPPSKAAAADDDGETSGFQVSAIRRTHASTAAAAAPPSSVTWFFTAPSASSKRQWVHAIKHELDFALAERYLDEEAQAFARLAAQHLAASVGASASASNQQQQQASSARLEGYLRVRHQSVGAMWRERFAVVLGSTLWLLQDGSDALATDWQRRALERHELLSAERWHAPPPSMAVLRALTSRQTHRHGLRLENQDGALLEVTFATEEDRETWLGALATALEARAATAASAGAGAGADRLATRDPALPFVPGAAMEGYLHVRVRGRQLLLLAPRWKTRYGVLLGVQLLLYATQEQAVALHGHSMSSQSESESESHQESEDALPQAVYEVLHAETWRGRSSEAELETHAFVVAATKNAVTGSRLSSSESPGAAVGDVLECRAHTSLERKRWLDAMDDQVRRSREEQALVAHALQEHGDKERAKLEVKDKLQALQADASRASMVIQDVLNSFASTQLSSDSDSDWCSESESEGGSDDGKGRESKAARPTALPAGRRRGSLGLKRRSPENSPLYHSQQPGDAMQEDDEELVYVEFPASPPAKRSASADGSSWWDALTGCCLGPRVSREPERAMAMASIAPLHNPMYRYDCYHEDTPVWQPERMDDAC